MDGLECRRELFLFGVSWHHRDFPALPWLGSPIHYEPLFHCVSWALHRVPRGPTHQSVSYQKSFKPRYRQTQIQANSDSSVSSANNSLCVFDQDACFLGGSLSLSVRLAASKQNPWVLGYSPLSPAFLGSELASEAWEGPSFQVEPSGHTRERTRLDIEHLRGFENCLLAQGLMNSEKLERSLPIPLAYFGFLK